MNILDVDVLQVDVLDQYPLSAASVVIFGGTAAAGKEAVFQQGATHLTITLGDATAGTGHRFGVCSLASTAAATWGGGSQLLSAGRDGTICAWR